MFGFGPFEIVVIGAIAVMLYGRRLPEVGRTVGKTLGELRRQWATLAADMDLAAHIDGRVPVRPARTALPRDEAVATAPRFDPPAAESPPSAP